MNLAFACSLRMGELLGLTWDCVDITPESIQEGRASIYVNKELQRVRKDVMDKLEKKDVLRIFPGQKTSGVTILVLKKPKTETSTRRIFLSKTVSLHGSAETSLSGVVFPGKGQGLFRDHHQRGPLFSEGGL